MNADILVTGGPLDDAELAALLVLLTGARPPRAESRAVTPMPGWLSPPSWRWPGADTDRRAA